MSLQQLPWNLCLKLSSSQLTWCDMCFTLWSLWPFLRIPLCRVLLFAPTYCRVLQTFSSLLLPCALPSISLKMVGASIVSWPYPILRIFSGGSNTCFDWSVPSVCPSVSIFCIIFVHNCIFFPLYLPKFRPLYVVYQNSPTWYASGDSNPVCPEQNSRAVVALLQFF